MTDNISEKEKFRLRKLVKELEAIRGRHTELVTVCIPAGYSFNEIVSQLRSEQSTAENIKSKSVRKNVVAAIDKIIRNLQLYKRPPKNGLAVYCGNVSEHDGDDDIQFWAIEPPEELNTKLYWCSQRFDLTPLLEMIEEKEIYAIICLDRQDADVALVIGKKIKSLVHMESIVPGKTRAGGQSSARFSRIREGLMHDWFKEIAEVSNRLLGEHKEIIGILISGTGPTKEYFLREELLHANIKQKILGVVDTSYTGEYGLDETLVRAQDLIKESSIAKEKNLIKDFLTELQKPEGLAVYGLAETISAIKLGAVSKIIVTEGMKQKNIQYQCGCREGELQINPEAMPKVCKDCNQSIKIIKQDDIADYLEELANNYGTSFIMVSSDTREGQQFLQLSGIGGFLRFRV
ncbi:MAG: peptide chain release factor 1 [Candidatus Aenigmarchaeota archaeon]|nr:peptide chain release factor 1 [Candidatus Aenigmarchaeota archaeon]